MVNGRTVSFKNCVIIMTSNLGAKNITDRKKLGFSNSESNSEENEYINIKKSVISELKKEFKPEFLNRIDETVIFHRLSKPEIRKIIDLMLKKVLKRLNNQNYFLTIDDSIKKLIEEKGIDINYGARPIRRAVQNYIEDKIAEGILNGEINKNDKNIIMFEEGKIVIKKVNSENYSKI